MGKMKNLVIEKETLAVLLDRAIDNGDLITCDRCGVAVLGEDMFGSVCNDCAMDLIEDGLVREQEQIDNDLADEMFEDLLSLALAAACVDKDVPVGAFDLDFFL